MGLIFTGCKVTNHTSPERAAEVARMMVDTGSELTWIDGSILRGIGVKPEKKLDFVTAEGKRIVREVGYAYIFVGRKQTVDEVVFAKRGDLRLLGARTLEGLRYTIDFKRKKLIAAGPVIAAGNRSSG